LDEYRRKDIYNQKRIAFYKKDSLQYRLLILKEVIMISKLSLSFKQKHINLTDSKDEAYLGNNELKEFAIFDVFIEVNGEKLIDRYVDFMALHLSAIAEDTSYHYIYNCSCGVPGCAGIYDEIKVVKEEDTIVWRFEKEIYDHLLTDKAKQSILVEDEDYVIVFDKGQYKEEIERLLEEMQEARNASNMPSVLFADSYVTEENDIIHYNDHLQEALKEEFFYDKESDEDEVDDYE
jgi:hypothetical protein